MSMNERFSNFSMPTLEGLVIIKKAIAKACKVSEPKRAGQPLENLEYAVAFFIFAHWMHVVTALVRREAYQHLIGNRSTPKEAHRKFFAKLSDYPTFVAELKRNVPAFDPAAELAWAETESDPRWAGCFSRGVLLALEGLFHDVKGACSQDLDFKPDFGVFSLQSNFTTLQALSALWLGEMISQDAMKEVLNFQITEL